MKSHWGMSPEVWQDNRLRVWSLGFARLVGASPTYFARNSIQMVQPWTVSLPYPSHPRTARKYLRICEKQGAFNIGTHLSFRGRINVWLINLFYNSTHIKGSFPVHIKCLIISIKSIHYLISYLFRMNQRCHLLAEMGDMKPLQPFSSWIWSNMQC